MTSIVEPSEENVQPMPVVAKGTARVEASGSATNVATPQSLVMRRRRA